MRYVRIVAGAAVALVAIFSAYSLYYRASLHDWPWEGDPAGLSMCGRDFAADFTETALTGAQMKSRGIEVNRLYPIFRAPPIIGSQVYSDLPPARRAAINRQPGEGCGGSLIIKDSPNRYRLYYLQGGP